MCLQHTQCRNCLWKKDCAYYPNIDRKCAFHNTKKQFVSREIVKRTADRVSRNKGEESTCNG